MKALLKSLALVLPLLAACGAPPRQEPAPAPDHVMQRACKWVDADVSVQRAF